MKRYNAFILLCIYSLILVSPALAQYPPSSSLANAFFPFVAAERANNDGTAALIPTAAFTPGNIVIYRVGDGVATLNSNATAVFLDEYTVGGSLVQSIPLPTSVNGLNKRLTASGTATTEGFLTRSVDGQYLLLTGYDADLGTASITGSTSAAINRVVGRVNAAGNIDTTTALTDAISGGNPRSATSTNGTDLWISGTSSGGGIRYATLGSTTSTALSTTPNNLRVVGIFGGQLYVSSNTTTFHLSTVGIGTPTTSGQTITNLPGFPTTGGDTGFFFADLDPGVAGVDTLYVSDDADNQVQKYSLVAGSWTANGSLALSAVRGLAATVSGINVTLYVTTASTLQTATDTSGYNATINGTLSSVATAGTNTAFRGVALAPVSIGGTAGVLAFSSPTVSISEAGSPMATILVTRTGGSTGGVTVNYATSNGTATGGAACGGSVDFVNSSGTLTWPNGISTAQSFTIPICNDAIYEGNETVNMALSSPTGGATIGSPGSAVLTINEDDSAPTLTINDVSLTEGNSGTKNFTFTVTKTGTTAVSAGVNFATADGTATQPSDYASNSGGLTFLAGDVTKTITIVVNGDTAPEPDETFFVNLSGASNATITDNQGLGTITNDDAARRTAFDYDGDGRSDVSIFRPSTGEWWLNRSTAGVGVAAFGTGTDKITPSDFTGDGKTDIAFFRPSTGQWFVVRSEDFSFYAFPFGTAGDAPVTGDYDGDSKADAAVFRPSNSTWFILRSSDGGVTTQQFGTTGDVPVAGDYDGDGKTDIAIFRPNGGTGGEWWISRSSGVLLALTFGTSTDKPVIGDYTGDGKTDIAFWRQSTGEWYVLRSENFSFFAFPYGASSDVPAQGDYDGDGKTEAAVFRASSGVFFINAVGGSQAVTFGTVGDVPTPSAYNP